MTDGPTEDWEEKAKRLDSQVDGDDQDIDLQEELDRIEQEAERIAESARVPSTPEPPDWEYQRPDFTRKHLESEPGTYRMAGIGFAVAYMLVGAVGGGWAIGWLVDRAQGSGNVGQAIGVIVGSILGLVAVVIAIVRSSKHE